ISDRKTLEAELRSSKEDMRRIANMDALTNLPNRRHFQAYLEALVRTCAGGEKTFHLGLMDIDSFKEVNDSFGHYAGDILLQCFAERLGQVSEGRAFIARMGGDEFAAILEDATEAEAKDYFASVLVAVREPLSI